MANRILFFGSSVIFLFLSLLAIPGCNWFSSEKQYDLGCLDNKENTYSFVIIGSGPAGLSAGLYGARSGKTALVIEGPKPGGLLTETTYVENWPGFKAILGKDVIRELKEQAAHFGAQFLEDIVEKVDFTTWPFVIYTEDGKKIYALTVIIATGASPIPLNVPGEKEYWGKGVTTCAICDAPFFQNKDVVVVGGGDSAVAEAIQLSAYAKKITILVRKDKMRAAATNQELLKGHPHVSVIYNVEPKVIGGDGAKVTYIELYNNKDDTTTKMPIDGVFLAIGHKPNSALFKDAIKLDEHGYILVKGRTQETSVTGVYAAGDVEDHRYRQAGVAAGDGSKAALDADMFLNAIGVNSQVAARLQNTQIAPVTIVPSLVKHVASLSEFEKELHDTKNPIFVDFYADYCPTCMAMLPHFNALSAQFKDYATFISVDIAALPDLAAKYFVNKIPCILVFKDGSLAARYNNAMSKAELQEIAAQFVDHTSAAQKEVL